jgi:D-alanyl-D-alanine carboxypeptidase
MAKPSDLLAAEAAPSEPIPVYTGPTKTGPALIAAVAMDTEMQAPPRRGKKSRVVAKKPNTADAIHANAKPDGTPKVAEKPAKPKAVAKPKPAPKSTTSEANPVDQKTATAPHT